MTEPKASASDNGVQFAQTERGTGLTFPHIFGRSCRENGIEHRLTKPYHPRTNGQAERMVRTIKEATVKSFHYGSIIELRRHVRDWLVAYNFAKKIKALCFKTPYGSHRAGLEIQARGLYRRTTLSRATLHAAIGGNESAI